jgi:hypothetical protein
LAHLGDLPGHFAGRPRANANAVVAAQGFAAQLEADGLLNSCRAEVMQCFLHWIENFSVIHFDKAECQANGYSLSYFDYVHNSEVVCETLCDLDRFIRHLDIADDFFERLAKPTAPAVSEFVTSKRGINTLQG